jgi:hypothetical protein
LLQQQACLGLVLLQQPLAALGLLAALVMYLLAGLEGQKSCPDRPRKDHVGLQGRFLEEWLGISGAS